MNSNTIKDAQTGREICISKKVLGEENLTYRILDINDSPFVAGRVDLLSYFIYQNYSAWRYLVNANFYRDPFELLDPSYDSEETPGRKYIKVVDITTVQVKEGSAHPLDGTNLFG